MIDKELIKIWQSSPNQERIKFDKSRLIIDVQSSIDLIHKKLKFRDLIETVAAIIVIPVFAFYIYIIPFTLSKVASALIIIWVISVIFRLRKAKKNKPSAFSVTYLEYLHKTQEYLNAQKQLLDTVLYWYILPFMTLTILFLLGFIGIAEKPTLIIITGVGSVALGIVIYYLNKKAVKKEFIPRLDEVEKLIKIMEE